MYDSILAPINISSDETERILTESLDLAHEMNAELYILHAFSPQVPEDIKKEEEELFTQTVSEIDESINVIKKDIKPVQAITTCVQEKNIDVVVLAPTNRSKLKKIMLGSVTEQTIKQVNANVLVLSNS